MKKMCYETQMPPYEANSRGGHHRQNPRSRIQNLQLQYKGLVTSNMHMKIEPFLAKKVLKYCCVKVRVREMEPSKSLKIFIDVKNIFVSQRRHTHSCDW
jgi:hypothetical protein